MDPVEYDINISVGKIRVFQLFKFENRPAIIFLHDSLGCIKLWRDFPLELGDRAKCNILVYDRKGHGASSPFSYSKRDKNYMEAEAEILHELLGSCNVSEIILFGHSDGGSISLIYGAKFPENVIGIITEGAHIYVEDETLHGIKEAVKSFKTSDKKSKLEKYHNEKTEALINAWADTWLSEEFRDWNIENILPKINCPVLVIQGENDEFGTNRQVDDITQKITGLSTGLIIPDTRHTPHNEYPELIIEKSHDFISGLC